MVASERHLVSCLISGERVSPSLKCEGEDECQKRTQPKARKESGESGVVREGIEWIYAEGK